MDPAGPSHHEGAGLQDRCGLPHHRRLRQCGMATYRVVVPCAVVELAVRVGVRRRR